MTWIPVEHSLPSAEALILAEGVYYLAILVADPDGGEPAFLDIHSSDLLPWPSHWMELPPPPAA